MANVARDFREQIGGIRISEGCRLIDGIATGLSGKRSRNSEYVLSLIGDAEWRGHEKGTLRGDLNGAICRATPAPVRSAIWSEWFSTSFATL